MGSYSQLRRDWADHFLPEITQIIGPYMLTPTPHEIDCTQAADLMVLIGKNIKIAVRMRSHDYLKYYRYQFTIRAKLDNGFETELSKIVNGFGDWFFYGFTDEPQEHIHLWWLISLNSFRAALIRNGNKNGGGFLDCGDKSNGDGTHFKWFDLRTFPSHPSILVASSDPLPVMMPPSRQSSAQSTFDFGGAAT